MVYAFLLQVQEAQEVLEDPWVAWEAVEETEEASHQEGPAVPEGTRLEEETSSTELETGSAPIRMYFSGHTDSLLVQSPYILLHPHSGEACWILFIWRSVMMTLMALLGVGGGGLVGPLPAVLEPSGEGHSPFDSGPHGCTDTLLDQTLVLWCVAA